MPYPSRVPYASEAQRRYFQHLLRTGKISPETVKEFDEASKGMTLPERLHPKEEKTAATRIANRLRRTSERRLGVYTVKRAESEADYPADHIVHILRKYSPSEERAKELTKRLLEQASVPVRHNDDLRTKLNLAYYDPVRKHVTMGQHVRDLPGVLAHELGHADAHREGTFLERATNSLPGRIAGIGTGAAAAYASAFAPKLWQKALGSAAGTALGFGTIYGAERYASKRSRALLERAGATPEELEANEKLQAAANKSYHQTMLLFPLFTLNGLLANNLVKKGSHATERMEERTYFHPSNVRQIQRVVDKLGLKPGDYHLPLRDQSGGVGGYAVFKGVSRRKSPVLATVLAKDMRPKGQDIEVLLTSPLKLKFKAP